jgi:hypothetical protein
MMNAEQKLYLNKRIAYTALMLQEYAYREILDSPSQIRKINNSSKATKAQIETGEDIVLDNISLMASLAASCSIMPNSQVDFIEKEFTKICLQAIENDTKQNQNVNS